MRNRECIVFEWTHDTEQRIHEPCACLWVPACSSCPQPIIGWIHLQHTHIAVAFACWNFFIVTVIHDFSKQIKQSTRIGKIFARWHLVIAITTKKIDIIQCITHYTNTLTKWKVSCMMAWDIGLVLFEHFYVHVKVHKDAKKKEWDQYPATLLKQAWSVIGGKTEHVILHKQSPQSFLLGYS